MRIEIEGIECRVPARYATHWDGNQKDGLARMVRRLKEAHGSLLLTVFVDRCVRGKATYGQSSWRYVGGYSTGTK